MPGSEKLKKLHSNLLNQGYDLPDYSTFEVDMQDDKKLNKLHSSLSGQGYDIPDYNTFKSDMGYVSKAPEVKKKDQPSQITQEPSIDTSSLASGQSGQSSGQGSSYWPTTFGGNQQAATTDPFAASRARAEQQSKAISLVEEKKKAEVAKLPVKKETISLAPDRELLPDKGSINLEDVASPQYLAMQKQVADYKQKQQDEKEAAKVSSTASAILYSKTGSVKKADQYDWFYNAAEEERDDLRSQMMNEGFGDDAIDKFFANAETDAVNRMGLKKSQDFEQNIVKEIAPLKDVLTDAEFNKAYQDRLSNKSLQYGLDQLDANDKESYPVIKEWWEVNNKLKDPKFTGPEREKAIQRAIDLNTKLKDIREGQGDLINPLTGQADKNYTEKVKGEESKFASQSFNSLLNVRQQRMFELMSAEDNYKNSRTQHADIQTSSQNIPYSEYSKLLEASQKEKDRYDNAYYEAKAKFDAINRALLLNENPASVERGLISGYGFLPALGEGLIEGFGGKVSTDEDFKQNFVKALSEKGVNVTKEQVDAAQLNIGQKAGSAIGNSIPAMIQIALTELATQGAGTLKAIPEIAKIFKAIEAASEANKAFKYAAIMTEGALKYGLTPSDDLTAAMGAGEELTQSAFDGMNVSPALAKTKWGKFLALGARSLGGGLVESAAEYGGEFTDTLSKNGYDFKDAFKRTVGRDYDEAKDKLMVTFLTSSLFSGTSNVASALVARNYYEAKGDTQRVEEIDNIAKENGIDLEKAKADFDKKVPTPPESTYTKTQENLIKTTAEQTGKPIEEVEKQLVEEEKIPDLSKENIPTTTQPAEPTPATLSDIESTAKALEGTKFNANFNLPLEQIKTPTQVSEAYHKAKADGSNPELVEAVEQIIGKPKEATSITEPTPTTETPAGKENANYISVYHGGEVSDLSDAENNLYVSENKSEAEAYAKGSDGSVKEFKINRNDIANEDEVRQIIVDLGLQSKEEGYDLSSELMLHEILDPRFSTSLNENDLLILEKELKNKGYKAIEMVATSMIEGESYATDILVLNPKETLKDDGGPITKKVGNREADIMFEKGYRPIVNGEVLKDITQSELDNLFESSAEVEMYIEPTPKKATPIIETTQEQAQPTVEVTTETPAGKATPQAGSVGVGVDKKRINKIEGVKDNFNNNTRALIGALNENGENVVGWTETEGSKISGITDSGKGKVEKLGKGVQVEFYNPSTKTTSKYFVEGDANKIIPFIENFVKERQSLKETPQQSTEKLTIEAPKPSAEVIEGDNKAEAKGKVKEKAAKGFISVALNKLTKSLKDFQGRGQEYSQQTYDRIVNEAKGGALNISSIPPIQIWKDKNGNWVILGGHSRTKAFEDLAAGKHELNPKYKKTDFASISAQIVEANTLEEAQKIAQESNQGAVQTVVDNAKYVREKLMPTFKSFNDAKTKLRDLYGAAWTRIYAYANLNPKGKAMAYLKAFSENLESESTDISRKMAEWTGKAMSNFNKLTAEHENEIFNYLLENTKIKTYNEFYDILNRRINGIEGFVASEPLNFSAKVGRGSNEVEVIKEIQDAKAEKKRVEDEIRKVQKTEKNKAVRDKTISELTKESIRLNTLIGDLEKKQAQAKEGDALQFNLFNNLNEQIENGNINAEQAEQFLDETNEAEPIIADIERKAESNNEAELNEAIKQADELINNAEQETPQVKASDTTISKKSILNSDTDLKGDEKDEFMLPVTYTQSKRVGDQVQFVSSQGEQIAGNYRGTNTEGKAIIDRPQSKDGKKYNLTAVVPESDVTFPKYEDTGLDKGSSDAIKYAIENDLYTTAISDGRMTATDAKKIIESAGLEVPKDIVEQSLKEIPQAETNTTTEETPAIEKTNTEKAAEAQRTLADKFRKLKIKKPDAGNLFASTPFDLVWDGALEVIAKSLEASASVTEAAGKALEHIKNSDWYKGLTSEQKAKAEQNLKTHIENEMSAFEAEQKPTEEPAKKETPKGERVKESKGFKRARLNELDPEIQAKLEGVANYKVQDNKEFNDKIIEFVDEVTPEIAIEYAMDMSENLSDGSAIRKKVILYNAGSKMKMKASEKLKNAKKEGDLAAESEAEAELALAYNAILTASKIGTAAGQLNAIDAELHKKYPSLYMIVAMNEFNKNGNEVLDDNTKFKDESGKDITVAEAIEKERVKIEDEIRKEVEKEFNSRIDELNSEIENLKKEKPVDKKKEIEEKQKKLADRRKEIIAQLKKSGGVAQATFIPFTTKQIELIGELIANLVQSGGLSSKQIINEVVSVVKSFNSAVNKNHIQDIAKSVVEFNEKLTEENATKKNKDKGDEAPKAELTPKKLKEIAMSHLFDRKGVPQTLAKAIIEETGMDAKEANAIAENISKSIIDPIIDEVIDRRLLNIIKPTETNTNLTDEQIRNKKENRKTANKIKEAIKLGVLSNNEIFQSAFEEKFGFRTLDARTKAKLNNIVEELTKLEADVSKTVSIDGKEATLDTTQRERILDLQKEFNTILQSSTPLNLAIVLSEINSAIYLSILSNPTSTSFKAFIGSFSGAAFGVFSDAFTKGPIATLAGIAATVKPSNIEASLQRAATALKSGLVEVGKTKQSGEFSSERQSAIENALFNGLSEAMKNKEKGKIILKSIGIALKNIRILAAMDAFLVSQTGIYSEAANGSKAKKGGFADRINPKNQEKVFNDIAEKEYSNIKSDIESAVDGDIKSGTVESKSREKEIERRLKARVGSITSPSSAYKTKRVQELTENQRIDNFKKAWSLAQYFSLIGKPDGLLGRATSWAQTKMAIKPTDNATDASLKFASQMVFKFVNLMGNMYNATMTSIPVLGLANAFFGTGYDPIKGEYVKGILGKYNANKPLLATRVATNLIITGLVIAALEDQLMWDDEEEKYVLNPDRDFDFRGAGFPGMGGYSANRRTNENYEEFSFSFTKDKNGKFTNYHSFNKYVPQLNAIVATVSAVTDDLKGMDDKLNIKERQDSSFIGYGYKAIGSNIKGFLQGSFNSLGKITKPFFFEESVTDALAQVATNTIVDNAGSLTRPNIVNSVINYVKTANNIPASKRYTLGEKLATAIYMENFFNQDKTDSFGNPIPQTQDFERFITEIPKQSELYPKTAGLMYKFDTGLEISKWRATEVKGYENFNLKGVSYYSTEDVREEATKVQEQEFNRLVTENYAKLNKMDYEKLNKAVKKYQEKSKEYAKKQLVDKYLDVNNKKSIIKKVEK